MKNNYKELTEERLKKIDKLVSTPDMIRNLSITSMKSIKKSADSRGVTTSVDKQIIVLNNIADSSIRKNYQIIFNSCCTLAVSVLNSILEQYFIDQVNLNNKDISKSKKDLKFKLSDLAEYNYNIAHRLGEIILKKDSSISFQDVNAIYKTLSDYGIKNRVRMPDEIEKKIIFYQQCRHIILHNDGKISDNFIRRVLKKDANIKEYKTGDEIDFNHKDWEDIKKSFIKFIEIITK